ncbi:MAG TPA: pitrilysin family protein [Candidatus Acidoferrum sp.]|nr:pitrilysin family protein [Candidatus Acidoferrum sp.]
MTATRTIKLFVTSAIFVFAASLASAQAPAPAPSQKQTAPAGGAPKPFNVPAHESYTLPNGMRVTLVPYGNIPKVAVSLAVRAGNLNEPQDVLGVADITGELLKEGTKTLSAQALAEAAALMGSSLSVTVGADETAIDVDVLSEYGGRAVSLVSDVAMHPLLPESELERLKANLLRQVLVAKSRPSQIALARFRKLLYGDHPYGEILPTEASLKKITIEDARKFYATNYGAERAHLYVAGKFDVAEVKKAIATGFSDWSKGSAPVLNVPHPKTERLLDVTDRPGAPQSTIYVGLPVIDPTNPDNIPLTVTNALLGGSFSSRITSNIREQKGYTYSPTSQLSRRYHDAYWAEIADVTTTATGPSLKEIFGEIDRLQKEPPAAAELKGIQSYMSGLFVIQNSTRQALIGQLRNVDLQGLGEDYLKNYVQRVNAVTPGDVQHMTAKYIKPEQMTIVVVGDKSKITEQLAPYAGPPEPAK